MTDPRPDQPPDQPPRPGVLGIASLALGAVALLIGVYGIAQSRHLPRFEDPRQGLIVLLPLLGAIACCVSGAILGLAGVMQENTRRSAAYAGIVLNILVGVVCIGTIALL